MINSKPSSCKIDIRTLLFYIVIVLTVLYDNTSNSFLVTIASAVFVLSSFAELLKLKTTKATIFIICFVLWAALTLIWTVSYNISTVRFGTCFVLCILLITMEGLSTSKVSNIVENSLMAYLIASLLLCFITYQSLGEYSILLMLGQTDRIGEDNLNTNMLGKYFAIASVVTLYFFFEKKWKIMILPYIILAVFVIMTRSRSALLSLVIGSTTYLVYYYRTHDNMKQFWKTMCVIALAIYGLSKLPIWGEAFYRITAMFDFFSGSHDYTADASSSMRETLLQAGLKAIPENPLLGHGIGSSPAVVTAHLGANYEGGDYFHNNYIQLLVETGFIGFTLFYMAIIIILSKLWNLRRESPLAVLLLSILAIFLFCDTNNTTYYHKVYMIFIGISILYIKKSQIQ